MSWLTLFILWLLVSAAIQPFFLKRAAAASDPRIQVIFMAYCTVLSAAWLVYSNLSQLPSVKTIMLLLGLGLLNSLALFSNWYSIKTSLSATAAVSPLRTVVTIGLALLLLNEFYLLNKPLLLGAALCLTSLILLTATESNLTSLRSTSNRSFLLSLLISNFVWGVINFCVRLFALRSISYGIFLTGWYGGSLIGSIALLALSKRCRLTDIHTGEKRLLTRLLPLSLFTWLSMVLNYALVHAGPLTVLEPLKIVSQNIITTIVGLVIFKEAAGLGRQKTLALLTGLIGSCLIATASFR